MKKAGVTRPLPTRTCGSQPKRILTPPMTTTTRQALLERFPDRVVPFGTFAIVARDLGVSQQAVSKAARAERFIRLPRVRPPKIANEKESSLSKFVRYVRFGDCWEWEGACYPSGYGHFRVTGYAHRFAYQALVGAIPKGLVIDHLCRNRACVRPEHLECVPGEVNILRGVGAPAQNARKTHCVRGHEFNSENTHYSRGKNGRTHRHCRVCRRIYDRQRRR